MSVDASLVVGILGVIVTAAGLGFVAQQVRDTRRLARAQFVSNLENDLAVHYKIYSKLLPGEPWSNTGPGPETSDELAEIIPYLGFFAKLKFLIELKTLDMGLVNRMFAFRFFLVVHNSHVQRGILFSELYHLYWSEIFILHSEWSAYRRERNLPILFEDMSLDRQNYDKYKASLLAWEAQA